MSDDLLPCPFCGSPSPRYQMAFGVRCSACDASVPCFGNDFGPWNRRALPATDAREKALREAAAMFDEDSNIAQTILALIGEART